jgi:hypothetical protein
MRRRGVYRDRTGVEGCQILRSDSQCKCIGFSEHRRRLWAIPAARIRALPRIFPRVADGNAEPRARRPRPRLSRCGVARARVKPDSGGAQSHDKPAVREAAARSRAIAEAPWEPWPQSSVETVTAQHIAAAAATHLAQYGQRQKTIRRPRRHGARPQRRRRERGR